MNFKATIRDPPPPSPHTHTSRSSSASAKKSPAGGVTLRRRCGCSGTPWSTGSRLAPSCRSSMLLCRRWRTSCWRRSSTSICRSPSRFPKCPRSHFHPVDLAGAAFFWCSRRRNSWSKCLRSYPFLLCVCLWSRTRTFQFLTVVAGWSGGGGLQSLRPGQVSSASSSHSPGAADEGIQGSELGGDFTPWTPAADLAHTISPKIITVLTRYSPVVLERI